MSSVKRFTRYYLIVNALLSVVLILPGTSNAKTPVCTNAQCKQRGDLYKKNMLALGLPCRDFYKFACGGWSFHNPRPPYSLHWSAEEVMQRETLEELQSVLKKPAKRGDGMELMRAKKVFKVCMDMLSLGRMNSDFIERSMYTIDFYKHKNVWDLHNEFLKLSGESALFDFQITANNEHENEPLLQFTDLKSPFGSIVILGQWSANQKKIYHSFLVNLVKSVRKRTHPSLQDSAIATMVTDVIAFRTKLNQIIRATLGMDDDALEATTLDKLQQWYDTNTKQTENSKIIWNVIARTLYTAQSDSALKTNPTVGIRRKQYFITLAELLAETPEKTIGHHFEIYFMERHVTFSAAMLQTLEQLVSKKNSFIGYIRNEEFKKSLKCVQDLHMDDVLGKLYVDIFFDKKGIPPVDDMLENLRDAIKLGIAGSMWLDRYTKIASINRINDIHWWIGYPPWYDNPLLKEKRNFMKPALTNAHLEIKANRVCINAALMKSPIYERHLPDVINYGSIGATVGHEVFHALDDCGQLKAPNGKCKNWWPTAMIARCQVQRKCFTDQMARLAEEQLQAIPLFTKSPALIAEASIADTFVEDVADIMGLDAAFEAYQTKARHDPKACATLPNYEGYSCDQMFFIAFANSLCGNEVPEIVFSRKRTHSPVHLRVNAAVMNSVGFKRAFNCSNNDPMDPEHKCNLWN